MVLAGGAFEKRLLGHESRAVINEINALLTKA